MVAPHRSKTAAFVLSLLLALAGALSATASANEPQPEPILRVETGTHTTLIRRIVVDAARGRVVTCGDDKTIRIWQMPEQRLVQTLRVPIDAGHEGQLFGLAISPDGTTIAAGGWTGWDWDKAASVYLFDLASGDLKQRIGGLDDAIHALAWSPDGQHLAIGLQGRAGLAVVRIGDGRIVHRDTQYRDKLTDLDFDRAGRLAAISLDGMARLYDAGFRLIGRRIVAGGQKPISVRFSPDATQLAIGFGDAPAVAVLSAQDLNPAFMPTLDNARDQQSIFSVAWSSDGSRLYASGDFRGKGRNPVYRWDNGGRGALTRIPAADNRISEIQTLPDGRMVFAAEDPGFGVIGADGRIESFKGPDILDFSNTHGQLRISADGATIAYPAGQGRMRSFNALGGGDQQPGMAPTQTVLPPQLTSRTLRLENWQNSFKPLVNGQAPALDDYEMVRSHAFAPDRQHVLLGTEWALRLLDERAAQKWAVKLAAVAWSVAISDSGRFALAALSDGSLRWYSMADGREVFAYFPHRNGDDWIAWIPRGYYMSSYFGDNYVGWHVNRGKDAAPDFFRAVQFDRVLYRPDLVNAAFRAALEGAADGGDVSGLAVFKVGQLREIAPPRLSLRLGEVQQRDGQTLLQLILRGERGGAPTQDFAVYVNGIPVTPGAERRLAGSEGERFTRSLTVPLAQRQNQIRVESFNGLSMGIAETYLSLPGAQPLKRPPGDLYVLAVGVNSFTHLPVETHLAFAAQDAEEITRVIQRRAERIYRKVHTRVITDHTEEKPLGETIRKSLEFVQRAQGNDTVVVFLASHGISDTQGNYYFVPRDAAAEDIDRLVSGGEIRSLLPWTTFFDGLRQAAGRRILIVDTCQASRIEGRFESHSLLKRSAASLFSLMLASKGGEYSQEHTKTGHGLFTYSLMSAMERSSDADRDGLLTQEELFAAATRIVDRNRDRRAGPQTPQLVAPDPLGNTPLVSSAGG